MFTALAVSVADAVPVPMAKTFSQVPAGTATPGFSVKVDTAFKVPALAALAPMVVVLVCSSRYFTPDGWLAEEAVVTQAMLTMVVASAMGITAAFRVDVATCPEAVWMMFWAARTMFR